MSFKIKCFALVIRADFVGIIGEKLKNKIQQKKINRTKTTVATIIFNNAKLPIKKIRQDEAFKKNSKSKNKTYF